ncbi:hypothetical protein FOZ62_000788, partial [Perkinsus olseni]
VANHREEYKCMEQANEGGRRATCADHNESIGSPETLEVMNATPSPAVERITKPARLSLGGVEWEKKLANAIPTCVSSHMKSPPKASSSTKQKKGRPAQAAAAYIVADWVIPYRRKFTLALKVWWKLLPRALTHIREKEPNVMAAYTLVHNNRPDYEIDRYFKLNFTRVGRSSYSKNHQVYAFFYDP